MSWKKAKSIGKGVTVWYRTKKPEAEVHVLKKKRGYEVEVYIPEISDKAKNKKEAERKAREYMKKINSLAGRKKRRTKKKKKTKKKR